MRIRILVFEGCPSEASTLDLVHRLLQRRGLTAEVERVEVGPESAARERFLGSPTIQIDGVDIEPAARSRTDYGMTCRRYHTPQGMQGTPPHEMIDQAIKEAAGPGR